MKSTPREKRNREIQNTPRAAAAGPESGAGYPAAIDELMSRQPRLIVCDPSRTIAGRRRGESADAAADAPIVILTESGEPTPIGPSGAARRPRDAQAIRPDEAPPLNAEAPALRTDARAAGAADRPALEMTSPRESGRPWSDLAQTFAQEIRAPLTMISEYCALVRDGMAGAINSRQGHYLALAADQVDDLNVTLQGIARIGDLESGAGRMQRGSRPLHETVAGVVSAIANKAALRGLTLREDLPEDLPAVFCDCELLESALTILACEIMRTASAGSVLWIGARARVTSSEVVVEMRLNNGESTSSANRPTARPPAPSPAQRNPLWLTLVREMVSLNFGVWHAESSDPTGHEFSLPFADPEIVIARYIEACRRRFATARWVYLLMIELESPAKKPELAAAVEQSLREVMQQDNLLFPLDDNRWLLVVEGEEMEHDWLLEEVGRRWDLRRRHRRPQFPAIRATLNAMYQISPDLKARAAPGSAAADQPPPEKPRAEKQRILVVDDEPNLVQALRLRLTVSGFEVLTAADGPAGLAAAISHRPDLVVLDIRMPKMDGLTVLDRLQEHADTKAIPVVIVSASHVDRRAALQRGARYFLEKPYDSRVLMTTITAALGDPASYRGLS